MPTYIHLANFVFDKAIIEKKYKGGCAQFRIDWGIEGENYHQEDDELFSIARMNIDELNIDNLTDAGLDVNDDITFSNDFVPISRYGGAFWKTDWLAENGIFAWHKNAKQTQIDRAKYIGGEITMDKIDELADQGVYVMDTIKTGNNDRE